jgi:hypothetical protein
MSSRNTCRLLTYFAQEFRGMISDECPRCQGQGPQCLAEETLRAARDTERDSSQAGQAETNRPVKVH